MAAGKRRPPHSAMGNSVLGAVGNIRSNHLNFRPNVSTEDRGGTRPTSTPASISLVLVTTFIHLCKKSLLFNTRLKVCIYCGAIFLISLVADVVVIPRTYFSSSGNILNRYFVKWGWAWLLVVTVPWITLTAHIIGCGRKIIIFKHLGRVLIATFAWLAWIQLFNFIETNYGRCLNTRDPILQTKAKCLQAGRFWSGLDISGHSFILIYASLILAEEGSSIIGWEGIKDHILQEEHIRSISSETNLRPLRTLCEKDLTFLKKTHEAFTPYLRGLFIAMTMEQLLWDVMLVSTMLYYHIMVEKFLGGIAAVVTWYVTYQWWYKLPGIGLPAPGEGLFKYNDMKLNRDVGVTRSRRNTLNGTGLRFMGMPLRSATNNADLPSLNRSTESGVHNF